MSEPFAGAKLKVERAYEHVDQLEAWINGLIRVNADTARAHKQSSASPETETVTVLRTVGFSKRAALIIGDAVHNLRSALDLVASEIVSAAGDDPADPPLYFPLGDTRQALITSSHYARIKRASPVLGDIIANIIKPYMAGDGEPRFSALNKLDRMDKHRLLIPTVTAQGHLVVSIREEDEDDPPPVPPGAIYALATIERDGIVLREGRYPRPGTKAYLHNLNNGYGTITVCFGKDQPFERQPVVPTLREIAELIGGTVETLAAHCLASP